MTPLEPMRILTFELKNFDVGSDTIKEFSSNDINRKFRQN